MSRGDIEQVREEARRKKKPFLFKKMTRKKFSSGLVKKPLPYLEFNKPNTQNVYD